MFVVSLYNFLFVSSSVKPAIFDLVLSIAIAAYLALVYILMKVTHTYPIPRNRHPVHLWNVK